MDIVLSVTFENRIKYSVQFNNSCVSDMMLIHC